jgi:hypothetical protein
MDLILTINDRNKEGIFGSIEDTDGNEVCVALQHAFQDDINNHYISKLAEGTYVCTRGMHKLSNLIPFETFEVMNVPRFQGKSVTGILFHPGNFNQDSDGCVLVGSERNGNMIMDSKATFKKFMDLQSDVDSFILTVR